MASISRTHTKAGKTTFQVRWRPAGTRDSKARAKTFPTLAAAKKFAATLELQPGKGSEGRMTFAQYREQWLASQFAQTEATGSGQRGLSPSTVAAYRLASAHLLPTLGDMKLGDITNADCRNAIQHVARCKSPATVRLTRACARKMFGDLVARGTYQTNPMPTSAEFRTSGPQRQKLKCPTPDQVMAMAQQATNMPDRALVLIAASTGARRSELAGLRWCDLDLGEQPHMHIRRTVTLQYDAEGKPYVAVQNVGKTDSSLRAFPLSEPEAAILRSLHDEMVAAARRNRADWSPNAYVWPRAFTAQHEPQNPKSMTRRLARMRDAAGISPDVSPMHGLRHASATQMLGRVPTAILAKRLGHSSPAITMSIYTHPDETHMAAAADAAGAAWGQALAGLLGGAHTGQQKGQTRTQTRTPAAEPGGNVVPLRKANGS
ncbi:tyrosine-type recombinase/integrase [Salipiger mangrovisoli]|uniref:Site-specific integrase n=1 Tax=Salipiger mangrovisoli TaxID=2865933 RepID=A0ABR9X423_9RHOB|nr:site-specific integrase [Salipiger mangrovisoli]MBE9638286.1 site-specific integrase [Salipiger mangrovisoli]